MKKYITIFLIPILAILTSFTGNNAKLETSVKNNDIVSSELPANEQNRSVWTISGYIYKNSGMTIPFPEVTVSFGSYGTVQTNQSGFYSLAVPHQWTGIVTPSFCSSFYQFTPNQRSYSMVNKHYSLQNFYGVTTEEITISGVFTHSQTGAPLVNQLVNFTNGMSAATNDLGEYSITVAPCFSDTLKPVSPTWNFSPAYRVYQNLVTNSENQSFGYIEKTFGIPPGWEWINTGAVHIISVFTTANPNLCGVPLQQGDYIGVFYVGDDGELHCGGAGEWTGSSNTGLFINGDDSYTPEKDGFSYGETMNWKVYKWTTDQQEYFASPIYRTGGYLVANNKWYSGGMSIVDGLNVYHSQQIVIPAGWSGISGYLTPKVINLASTMSPIINELVIMQTLTKMYYPGQGINTIINWNVNDGYKIKVTEDVILPFPGCPLTNRSQNMVINWNIMPVKSECYVSVASLFNPVINKVKVVKEIAGSNVFWPEMGITTLQTLSPGKAYMVSLTQSATVTFPACTGMKSDFTDLNAVQVNKTIWPDPMVTPASHIAAISAEALQMFSQGDFIGAFTQEGICAGMTEITGFEFNSGITIFGNDPTGAQKVGFDEGETLSFRLFKAATGEVFNLLAYYDQSMPAADGVFMENGLSLINGLYLTSTGSIDSNLNGNPRFFPNPTNGIINIIADGDYTISTLDVLGKIVFFSQFSGNNQVDFSNLHKGIYFIKIEGQDYLKVEKLMIR